MNKGFKMFNSRFGSHGSQGRRANESGLNLETEVEKYLISLDIVPQEFPGTNIFEPGIFGDSGKIKGRLLKNVPYLKFVGKLGKSEFVLDINPMVQKESVKIECRKQGSSGSVDEKLPTLYKNAIASVEKVVLLVVEGEGFCKYALRQLDENCRSTHWKIIKKVNLEEFKIWIKDYLERGPLKWPQDYSDWLGNNLNEE
jgi:hypothetical protein